MVAHDRSWGRGEGGARQWWIMLINMLCPGVIGVGQCARYIAIGHRGVGTRGGGPSARRAMQRLACVGDDDTMMRVPLSRRVMHRLARGSCVLEWGV